MGHDQTIWIQNVSLAKAFATAARSVDFRLPVLAVDNPCRQTALPNGRQEALGMIGRCVHVQLLCPIIILA